MIFVKTLAIRRNVPVGPWPDGPRTRPIHRCDRARLPRIVGGRSYVAAMPAAPTAPSRPSLLRRHLAGSSHPSTAAPAQGAFDDLIELSARSLRELTFVV